MQISPILRTAAYLAADIMEHQPISMLRSAASDLRWYAHHGHSRNSRMHPGLFHVGPIAITRPVHRVIGRAVRDLRDAWVGARNEVDIGDSCHRVESARAAP